jgi:hypothetical protein
MKKAHGATDEDGQGNARDEPGDTEAIAEAAEDGGGGNDRYKGCAGDQD